MGATITAVGQYFAGSAAAGATNAALIESAIGTAGYGASSATVAAGATGAGAGLLQSVGEAAAGAAATSLLTPKPDAPELPGVTPMPDPLAQQEARRKAIAEQMTRSGRASTILTNGSGKLGG